MDKVIKQFAIELCKAEGKNPHDSFLINFGTQSYPSMQRVENWESYVVRAKRYANLFKKAKEAVSGN